MDGGRLLCSQVAPCLATSASVAASAAFDERWEIPAGAAPPGASLALRAVDVGEYAFECLPTDVVGAYGWRLRRSSGTLYDEARRPIGGFQIDYEGAPVVHAHGVWRDVAGGAIEADDFGDGLTRGYSDLQWRRFRVAAAKGESAFARASFVVRVAAWKIIPYESPCNAAHKGARQNSRFEGADLFVVGSAGPSRGAP